MLHRRELTTQFRKIKYYFQNRVFTFKIPNYISKAILAIVLGYFLYQSVYFALNIQGKIFPDEPYHLQLIEAFSSSTWLPSNSALTYSLGSIERIPYLYHFLLGKLLYLNIFGISNLFFLRLLNVGISLVTIIVSYLLAKEYLKTELQRLFAMILLTNTLMFSFQSGAITYDSLSILLSVLSIYLLLRFNRTLSHKDLLLLCCFIGMSALTKMSLIPLAVFILFFACIVFVRYRMEFIKRLKLGFRKSITISILLILFILVLFGLNSQLYGGNFLKYKKIVPSCNQVMTHEQCMKNSVYARDFGITKSKTSKVDRMSPFLYFSEWSKLMAERTFGIMGHKIMFKSAREIFPYYLLGAMVTFFLVRKLRFRDVKTLLLLGITVSYTLMLAYYVNYQGYLQSGIIVLAVQGRYLFPVLPAVYLIVSKFLLSFKFSVINWILFFTFSVIFIVGGFPYFLSNVQASWLNGYSMESLGLGLNDNDHIPGGIKTKGLFTQSFASSRDNLTGLQIFVSVYGFPQLSDYELLLFEGDCRTLIDRVDINECQLKTDTFFSFIFNPMLDSKGQQYCFSIDPVLNETPEFPITLQMSKEGIYTDGELILSGKSLEKDIVFQPIYLE